MSRINFPSLTLNGWRGTRDTIHKYVKMVGAIRQSMSDPQPHWWHISLRVSEKGLATTPIPSNNGISGQTFEMILDLVNHQLVIESNFREVMKIKISGQSLSALCEETCSLFNYMGISIPLDKENFIDGKSGEYNEVAASNYWNALKEIDKIMNTFRSTLKLERSPVQLWPHHFDLSMSWFSGRLVPGKDPNDAESSKEQMMFGFSTGDDNIPDPYFYILAYPLPEGFPDFQMPEYSRWNTDGFQGGVMMYDDFAKTKDPEVTLLNFFRTFQIERVKLMRA